MDSKQGTSQKIAVLGGRSELNPNARMGNKKKKKKAVISPIRLFHNLYSLFPPKIDS